MAKSINFRVAWDAPVLVSGNLQCDHGEHLVLYLNDIVVAFVGVDLGQLFISHLSDSDADTLRRAGLSITDSQLTIANAPH